MSELFKLLHKSYEIFLIWIEIPLQVFSFDEFYFD